MSVWVFFAGWESARDSVDFTNLESSFFELERSFFVTDRWIPFGWEVLFWAFLSWEDFIMLVVVVLEERGMEFLAGVTTVSVLLF